MVILWMIVVMFGLLSAVGGALIALRIQYWVLDTTHREREAWQQAQESRQRTWEVRQGKHILEIERRLGEQVKDVRKDFREWSLQVEERQQVLKERIDIEQELARLPHIEDIELPFRQNEPHQRPERWQPPALYGADLRGRDLSYRYMGRADLRDAMLAGANLYMANLAGASLEGANLENANLVGVNFTGSDLRGANLSGANLLVADLHRAVLHGATLQNTQNFTLDQLQTALYDDTTLLDESLTSTLTIQTTASVTGENQEKPTEPVLLEGADQIATSSSSTLAGMPESTAPGVSEAEREANPDNSREMPETRTKDARSESNVREPAESGGESGKTIPLPTRKIIELATRVPKSDLVPGTKNKRGTQSSSSRVKRKGMSHINKISRTGSEKDKRSKAN
jgi:Pentapeptide repeats (8 copies)